MCDIPTLSMSATVLVILEFLVEDESGLWLGPFGGLTKLVPSLVILAPDMTASQRTL